MTATCIRRVSRFAALMVLVSGLLAGISAPVAASAAVGTTSAITRAESMSSAAQLARDPVQARIRKDIARRAINQIGAREHGGMNYYPKRYQKINKKHIVRPAEWCGVFTNWSWAKAGVTKRPSMNPARGVDQGHYATYWQKWGKTHRRWKPVSARNPAIGDVIVYGNYPASKAHVGVVVGVKYDRHGKAVKIRTVEGNVSDQVADLGWRKISNLTAYSGAVKASGFVSPV